MANKRSMSFLLPPDHATRLHAAVGRRMLATGTRASKNDLVAEALEAWLVNDENAAKLGKRKKSA